jgi:predicted RecA/RadA family phage recombinase
VTGALLAVMVTDISSGESSEDFEEGNQAVLAAL